MADDDMLSVLDRAPGCSPGDGRPDCSLDMDPGLETLCGGGDVDVDVVGNGETNREPMACLDNETMSGSLVVHSAPAYAQMDRIGLTRSHRSNEREDGIHPMCTQQAGVGARRGAAADRGYCHQAPARHRPSWPWKLDRSASVWRGCRLDG
jgi:hypothetical protein